jgi:hypothetical protein
MQITEAFGSDSQKVGLGVVSSIHVLDLFCLSAPPVIGFFGEKSLDSSIFHHAVW